MIKNFIKIVTIVFGGMIFHVQLTSASSSCDELFGISKEMAARWNEGIRTALLSPNISVHKTTQFNYSDEVGEGFVPDTPDTVSEEQLEQSFKSPVEIDVGVSGKFGGGVVLYQGELFPDELFVLNYEKKRGSLLGVEMPWIGWDRENNRFQFHNDGGSRRILELLQRTYGNKIVLYRGLHPIEIKMFEGMKLTKVEIKWLEDFQSLARELALSYKQNIINLGSDGEELDLKTKERFEKRISILEIATEKLRKSETISIVEIRKIFSALSGDFMSSSEFGGPFLTLDLMKAQAFSKGAVIEVQISIDELQEVLSKKSLYVGFENGSMEFGFFEPDGIISLASNMVRSISVAPTAIWGDWADENKTK